MRRALSAAGLSAPRFEPDEHFFRVIFDRPPEAGRGVAWIATHKTTQKTTQSILDIIARKPGSTRKELAEATGVSDNGIKYHLRRMQKNGVLRRIGPDKGGHWEVVRKNSVKDRGHVCYYAFLLT
jgi:ATP-dependent DNA helicase RecG